MRLPLKFLQDPQFIDTAKSVGGQQMLLDKYNKDKANVDTMAGQYAESLKRLGEVQQRQIEPRQASSGDVLLMLGAELGKQLTSTLPESQRDFTGPLPMFRQISLEDQKRLQEAERVRAENQRNSLLANAQAEEAKYAAARDLLGMTQQDLSRAQQDVQFNKSELRQGRQFREGMDLEKSNAKFEQFIRTEALNLDREQFAETQRHNQELERLAGETEADKQARNFAALVKQTGPDGKPLFTAEEARNMTYGDALKSAVELQRTLDMYRLMPIEDDVKYTLEQRAREKAAFDTDQAYKKALTEAAKRSNRSGGGKQMSPSDQLLVSQLEKRIESNTKIAQTAYDNWSKSKLEGKGDSSVFDKEYKAAQRDLENDRSSLLGIYDKYK